MQTSCSKALVRCVPRYSATEEYCMRLMEYLKRRGSASSVRRVVIRRNSTPISKSWRNIIIIIRCREGSGR